MTRRYLICRQRQTAAGIALEDLGLVLHAASADAALATVRTLGLYAGVRNLVAIATEN